MLELLRTNIPLSQHLGSHLGRSGHRSGGGYKSAPCKGQPQGSLVFHMALGRGKLSSCRGRERRWKPLGISSNKRNSRRLKSDKDKLEASTRSYCSKLLPEEKCIKKTYTRSQGRRRVVIVAYKKKERDLSRSSYARVSCAPRLSCTRTAES